MTNRDRAAAARAGLAIFTAATYGGRLPEELGAPSLEDGLAPFAAEIPEDSDAQTMVGDFLCDLHHYCHAIGLDWDAQVAAGDYHYSQESQLGWDEEE